MGWSGPFATWDGSQASCVKLLLGASCHWALQAAGEVFLYGKESGGLFVSDSSFCVGRFIPPARSCLLLLAEPGCLNALSFSLNVLESVFYLVGKKDHYKDNAEINHVL